MVVSPQKRGPPYIDPKILIILIMGTPKRVPLVLGNPHITATYPRSDGHIGAGGARAWFIAGRTNIWTALGVVFGI